MEKYIYMTADFDTWWNFRCSRFFRYKNQTIFVIKFRLCYTSTYLGSFNRNSRFSRKNLQGQYTTKYYVRATKKKVDTREESEISEFAFSVKMSMVISWLYHVSALYFFDHFGTFLTFRLHIYTKLSISWRKQNIYSKNLV